MAMTNQERVGKAVDLLHAGLAPYVEREFVNAHKDKARAEARLHEKLLAGVTAGFREHKIHAAVGAATTGFDNVGALQPEALTHEHLELAPAHAIECIGRLAMHDIGPCVASTRRTTATPTSPRWSRPWSRS